MRLRRRLIPFLLGLTMSLALEGTSSGWIDATTSAGVAKGLFEIRGVAGHAIHTHGGPSAQLDEARFVFVNRSSQSHRVAVVDIEFLRGAKDCEQPPQKVVSHPKLFRIRLDNSVQRDGASQFEVKAGATVKATVRFAAVPAYYVYCDRFAFRVHFVVDGEKIAVVDEVTVSREEPLPEGSH